MNGRQIIFFTQQDKRHHAKPLADWLVHLARKIGLPGATLIAGSKGFDRHRRHSARFYTLAQRLQDIQIAVTGDDADRLFERLEAERMHLFHVKSAVEFGALGECHD